MDPGQEVVAQGPAFRDDAHNQGTGLVQPVGLNLEGGIHRITIHPVMSCRKIVSRLTGMNMKVSNRAG